MSQRARNLGAPGSRWGWTTVLVVGALALLGVASPGWAGGYYLQILARTGDTISGRTLFSIRGLPAINDHGQVMFKARTGIVVQSGQGIFTPDAAVVVDGDVIATKEIVNVSAGSVGAPLRLNNNGEVAFRARFRDTNGEDWALFTQYRVLVEPGDTISGRTVTFMGELPDFNDNGTVAFRANFEPGSGFGVFTQERLVAEVGGMVDGNVLTGVTVPSIAGDGRVAFGGQFVFGADPFSGGNFVEDVLVVKKGDEIGGLTLINIFAPLINDRGDLVFLSQIAGPIGLSRFGVFSLDRPVAVPDVIIDGKLIANLFTGTLPALNDSGEVAFTARFDVNGSPTGVGVFTQSCLVVAAGDTIEGKVVDRLDLFGFLQMNNEGQIPFVAEFTDDTSAVILASPLRPTLLTELVDDLVTEGSLDSTQGDVLIRKAEDAQEKLDEGQIKTAINQLEAFINKVESLINSGRLSLEDGQRLIAAAELVIAELAG